MFHLFLYFRKLKHISTTCFCLLELTFVCLQIHESNDLPRPQILILQDSSRGKFK